MAASPDPAESRGQILEKGESLLRPPEEAAQARRRRERPAHVGRFLLAVLGAVCAAAGVALALSTHVIPIGGALAGFGALLVGLGVALHAVLKRDRARWPEELHVWDEGIELLLHDGELRASAWTDQDLALDVFVRPRHRAGGEERLLVWRGRPPVPPCDLSEQGLARLMRVVVARGLSLSEYRSGSRTREARAYEIRGRSEPQAPILGPPNPERTGPIP
jgi:hypothetical protein